MTTHATTHRPRRTARLALVTAGALLTLAAYELGGEGLAAAPPTTDSGSDESLAGIDRPPDRIPGAAVGRIEGTGNFIAIVEQDGRVLVYLCNGTIANQDSVRKAWFEGAWDGSAPLTLKSSGMSLTIERDGDGYRGELETADGKRFPFTAAQPDESGGLYRTQDREDGAVVSYYTIVLEDGQSRGAFHTVITRCRKIRKTVVLADGTTTTIIVEICG
jgi:hypothetical protein